MVAVTFNHKHFKVVVGDLNETLIYFLLVLQLYCDVSFQEWDKGLFLKEVSECLLFLL